MYSFNNFTEKANESMNKALESAAELGHTFVGSEHILLGLLSCESGVASQVLQGKGIDREKIKQKLIETHGKSTPTKLSPNDFTPRSKRVMQRAMLYSGKFGHNYVGTEHLLISLMGDRDSFAVRFISEAGGNPDEIMSSALAAI